MDDLPSAPEATHLVEHFLVFRKASLFVFGEDQFAVDDDIELTGLADGQFRWGVKSILNFGRETHGARFVVSNVAINDFDLHVRASEPPQWRFAGASARVDFLRRGRTRGRLKTVHSLWGTLLSGMLLAACRPGLTEVVCSDQERCAEQEPLCENSCDYSIDRAGCRECCREMRRKCDNCKPPHVFTDCK